MMVSTGKSTRDPINPVATGIAHCRVRGHKRTRFIFALNMRSFLYPSITLMNRLGYRRKFALLGLVFFIAIAVVISSLFTSLHQVIRTSQNELDGTALIAPIANTIHLIQQHRGLSYGLLSGSGNMRDERIAREKDVDTAFKVIEEILPSYLIMSADFQRIKASWAEIRNNGLDLTLANNFSDQTRLIEQMLLFKVAIADEYALTLDADISTFYLIDTTINKLPDTLEHLGQLRALGTGILASKKITEQQKLSVYAIIAKLNDSLTPLKVNLEKTGRHNPVAQKTLSDASDVIADSAQWIIGIVESDILSGRFDTPPEDFMRIATEAIDIGYGQMHELMLPTTETLIRERIARAEKTLYTSIAIAILLFLIAAYFAIGVYQAVADSIKSLADAAHAFTGGDLSKRVNIGTRDEFSVIGNSFNEMADGFSAMLDRVAQREQEILRINTELETKVRERTEKLSEANEELQKAMRVAGAATQAKSDFLANISHEIRTPMNAIIGLSHLCMQTGLTAKQSDYLQKVHDSAKALLGLINDILDFSKIEAGKMEVERVRFELENVLGNLATTIFSKADEKELDLLFETSLDVYPHLVGDPMRLGQVLVNLAGNAVKFTDAGEVLVLTEMEEETADDVVLRFTIRDSGIGMTQEQIDKLFQNFTQADSSITRKFGGTGLGLSISKQLVGLMGGEIWVESTPGKGSTFIFTARFPKAAERRARKRDPADIDLRGMRVLAVDDNATCRHILHSYLESSAYEVTESANGFEALQSIEHADLEGKPCQLVIIDWKMPEMDGIETARRIRAMDGLSERPKILLISSYSQSEMLKYLEDEGVVDGILTKPFQQSGLFNATMEIFGCGENTKKKCVRPALLAPDIASTIGGAHLLLVEDNEINQQVAQELLERAGVTVTIAGNGKEAVERLWHERFDGVLMDMQMPVMDGIAATREIRKNPRLAALPIIAMTANAMEGDRGQCLASGMNDHIAKPIDPKQMMDTLARWVTPAHPTVFPVAREPEKAECLEAFPCLPGVLVTEGVQRMGGSVAVYYSVLEKFRSGQQHTLAKVRSAITAHDWEKAERLVHTLKGLLGTLGAVKLNSMIAELETAILGRSNARIGLLLPAIDSGLVRLFCEIDRALKLWSSGQDADDKLYTTTDPINMEELGNLVRQAKLQLEQFDSNVHDTITRIRRLVCGDDTMKKALVPVEQYVSGYDYERGLTELNNCADSLGISYS